jgi:hypothetical protein
MATPPKIGKIKSYWKSCQLLFYVFDSFWELPIYYNPVHFRRSKGFTQHPGQYFLAICQLYCKQHIKGFFAICGRPKYAEITYCIYN